MTPLAFIDTETTGLDADLNEIWEVGLILRTDEHDDDEFVWQLPVDLGWADPIALRIGGFYERYDYNGVDDLDYFAASFAELTRGCHLIGAVTSFDEERLRRLLRSNGACPDWHYHLCDVENLVAGQLRLPPPWKSDELSAAIGVEIIEEEKHTAIGDARWAVRMYDAVMTLVPALPEQ